jgi:hypothetical protein
MQLGLRRQIILNKVKSFCRFNFMLQRLQKNNEMISYLKQANGGQLENHAITEDYEDLVLDWKLKENAEH